VILTKKGRKGFDEAATLLQEMLTTSFFAIDWTRLFAHA
jgi:hypothetical protein